MDSISTQGSCSTTSDTVATPQTQKRYKANSVIIHQANGGSEDAEPVLTEDWLYKQDEVDKTLERSKRRRGNRLSCP